MKFNLFKLFKMKTNSTLNKMVSTKTKLEYIKEHYNDEVNDYILNSENLLVAEKNIKDKVRTLENQYANLEQRAKDALNTNRDAAKAIYVQMQGVKNALEMARASHKNVSDQCVNVRENLRKIDSNKMLLEAKIASLQEQIEVLKLADFDNQEFSFDCDAMLKEVEDEIKNKTYHVEAKKEIQSIMKPQTVTSAANDYSADFEAWANSVK